MSSTVIGIAESLHDSCLTVLEDGHITLHLELERVLRRKRAVFSSAQQVQALLAWLKRTRNVSTPDAIGVVRHAVEPITKQLLCVLGERYPTTQISSFEHLDCHAALASVSGMSSASVVALDGGGDRRVEWGSPNALIRTWEGGSWGRPSLLTADDLPIDGRAWAALSFAIFGDLHAAGKTMGLAAYGEPVDNAANAVGEFIEASLNWRYDTPTLERIVARLPLQDFTARANAAFALQEAFTSAMRTLIRSPALAGGDVILTGGCALNVTANAEIAELHGARSRTVWVPPCPGDEGISIGAAALAAAEAGLHIEPARFPYLGLGGEVAESEGEIRRAAELLARGGVLVVATGRGEIGPRALGNRSILALPSIANRRRVSEEMKGREAFRPVAPAIRGRDAANWLQYPIESPYMSFASRATAALKDECPGVVHIDGTARHQSVSPEIHPTLAMLLEDVVELGYPPVLINTSLNVAGSPICLDTSDALTTALSVGADGIISEHGFVRLN